MPSFSILVFLAIFFSVKLASNLPSLTIQCDHDHHKVINNSSDSSFHNDHRIILEECALENIPNILSNIPQQVAQVTSLLLKGIKHHPVKLFPHHYQCSPALKSVSQVKLVGTGGSVSGDYSEVLGYLSHCTSVTHLEILDTSLMKVMRLESSQTLQSLRLTNNHIAELQMEDLSALTKLRVLDLARNKLVRIPSRIFANNRKLRRLCLARNSISFVTRQSFLGKILVTYALIFIIYSLICCRSA